MAKAAKPRSNPRDKLEAVLKSKAAIGPDELHNVSGGQLGGRNSIYNACNEYLRDPGAGRGIECFRQGKRLIIPTAPMRRKLGLEVA